MKFWGGVTPPAWVREIAHDRARPLVPSVEHTSLVPQSGDIVLKPFIEDRTYKQLFRVETWNTHDLLDGPFEHVREALACAFEFGVTSRLAVWLDYSDAPSAHDLDEVPLYFCDKSLNGSAFVA
jgi:hypothetical protein